LKTIAPRLPQAVSNRARSMPLSSPGTCCRYTRQSRRTCDPARLAFQRLPHQGKRQQAEKGQRVPDLLCGCAFCDILCTGHFANLGTVFSRKYSVPRVLVWPTFIVGKVNAGAGAPAPPCQRISCILYSISCPQLETLTKCRLSRTLLTSAPLCVILDVSENRLAEACSPRKNLLEVELWQRRMQSDWPSRRPRP
jgi:hypothetical protein